MDNGGHMIRKGQQVRIKPEWQDAGDENLVFVAVQDEDGGRVRIEALAGMRINPQYVVTVEMIVKA
jgi:hypothetical protein